MIYDPLELTTELIKCRSVTPRNDGAIELLSEKLENIGFKCLFLHKILPDFFLGLGSQTSQKVNKSQSCKIFIIIFPIHLRKYMIVTLYFFSL